MHDKSPIIHLEHQPDFPEDDLSSDNLAVLSHHFKHNPEVKARTNVLTDSYRHQLSLAQHALVDFSPETFSPTPKLNLYLLSMFNKAADQKKPDDNLDAADSLEAFTSGYATYEVLSKAVRPRPDLPTENPGLITNWLRFTSSAGVKINTNDAFSQWSDSHPNTQSLIIDTTGPIESPTDTRERLLHTREIKMAEPEGSVRYIHTRLVGAYAAYLLQKPAVVPNDISELFLN